MPRYKYIPMDMKKDYLERYKNTLKTGEILVDLGNADIYVTEEGYNVPIPSTKGIKEEVINFLDNSLEGISLKRNLVPDAVENLFLLNEKIKDKQKITTDKIFDIESDKIELDIRNKHIETVNLKNINQLGDLTVNLKQLEAIDPSTRMRTLIDNFNLINNDHRSVILGDESSTRYNYELMEIYNELFSLMDEALTKSKGVGTFSGRLGMRKTVSDERNVYDVVYSRRLNNISNASSNMSSGHYISESQRMTGIFASWFHGNLGVLLGSRFGRDQMIEDGNWNGTGLFYKNFHNKVGKNGSRAGSYYDGWTLFEALPDGGPSPGYSISYLVSVANTAIPGYYNRGTGGYKNGTEHSFTSSIQNFPYTGVSTIDGRSYSCQGGGYMSPRLNQISDVDETGMQRIPLSTMRNASNGCYSSAYPALPLIYNTKSTFSSTPLANRDSVGMRLGLSKRIGSTRIIIENYHYDDRNGWR